MTTIHRSIDNDNNSCSLTNLFCFSTGKSRTYVKDWMTCLRNTVQVYSVIVICCCEKVFSPIQSQIFVYV